MKAVIIEDETAAAVNLAALLRETFPDMEIMATLESVAETVEWFSAGHTPDMAFMDIHLADGNSFLIFDSITVDIPIIFTTAYDMYALEAFKVNSIDYLLKPIKKEDLERAVQKLSLFSQFDIASRNERIADTARQYDSLLLHVRDKLVPVSHDEIAFCYTQSERVTIYALDGRRIPYDKSLDTIMEHLPEEMFYRINRQFVIARRAVKDITVWPGSRLSVTLCLPTPERIVVSKVRTPDFKRWIVKR